MCIAYVADDRVDSYFEMDNKFEHVLDWIPSSLFHLHELNPTHKGQYEPHNWGRIMVWHNIYIIFHTSWVGSAIYGLPSHFRDDKHSQSSDSGSKWWWGRGLVQQLVPHDSVTLLRCWMSFMPGRWEAQRLICPNCYYYWLKFPSPRWWQTSRLYECQTFVMNVSQTMLLLYFLFTFERVAVKI